MVHSNKRRREFDEDQDTGPKRTQWMLAIGNKVQVIITQGTLQKREKEAVGHHKIRLNRQLLVIMFLSVSMRKGK